MKLARIFSKILLLVMLADAQAQQDRMMPGQILAAKVDGVVYQVARNTGQRDRLNQGEKVRQGTSVETADNGSVLLLFDNGSTMNLRPNTKFSIDQFMRDPFDAEGFDYKNVKSEPSRSVTKVKVREGTIFFDLPKLKINEGSSCDISNPVGTAGIRGTAGWVSQDSMGCSSGSFQSTTQTGQSQTLAAGQSTGFTPQGNFGPPPANADQNMQGARNNSQSLPQNIPSDAFAGTSQNQAASQGDLTPEQQEAIEQAAQQGEEALLETVEQIASETPEAAATAAAAAAALLPEAAAEIASTAAAAVPESQTSSLAPQIAEAVTKNVVEAAPQIAAAVASVATNAAPQIAAAVASVATNAAPQVAAAVAQTVTGAAAQVAAAVTQVVPVNAPEIAGAVANVVPSQAAAIAQSVAQAAPAQANAIAQAVTNAAPTADANAVTNAAQQGAQQQSSQTGSQGGSSGGSSGGGSGAPPALPGGFGGGGGGSSGGGPIYGT